MSNNSLTFLIGGGVGLVSVGLWSWLVLVPAYTAYSRWWQRAAAVVMSVYVLAAMLGAGALVGALFLWYYDRIA